MIRLIFFIMNAFCGHSISVCRPKATSHIIRFRFGQSFLKDHVGNIEKVEFKWLKEEYVEFNTPVRSKFFTEKKKTLNVVLDDLFGETESSTVTYRVSFFTLKGKEIYRGNFNIEKQADNSFSMYSVRSRRNIDTLNYVYHRYLSAIFQDYRNFSIIPNSNNLIKIRFTKEYKEVLTNYFNNHRGMKEALESLNECLSEVDSEEDIPAKINKFFDGRREHVAGLQKQYSSYEQLYFFCAGVDCELSNLLMDILLLIEKQTDRKIPKSIIPILNRYNIFTDVKEVKVYDIPKTFCNIKNSKIVLKLLPEENMDDFYRKDIWIYNNNVVYVSQDLCKVCRELNWRIEVLNSKYKIGIMRLDI
ncbi:hypothetical protein NBO_845g0001 [Nosema bombycis CQ1]|uniref:Uncharacterized protein n=1 Tax=Nosema bombycis (strain CQ1 / CVCC 102059) TaxID=578461 RepID=R0MGA4_NOSB1|nr:hypothetical protein NBO_845g0001 [Nosema bombycis CQ1]|eukprot:EOB11783.1 hypothetical protein NBO_845g0001 [Nosema bombycis CQ1]